MIQTALRKLGVRQGDCIMFVWTEHEGINKPWRDYLSAFLDVMGPKGTIIVPTHSQSFIRRVTYDPATSPSLCGGFSEFFRSNCHPLRSLDPNYSVAAIGPKASVLTSTHSRNSHGTGSFFSRFAEVEGKICFLGRGPENGGWVRQMEHLAKVPTRYFKPWTGLILHPGQKPRRETWFCSVETGQPSCVPDELKLLDQLGKLGAFAEEETDICSLRMVGASKLMETGLSLLRQDAWLSSQGPSASPADLEALETGRIGSAIPQVQLNDARPIELVRSLTPFRRDIVSDGYDACLSALQKIAPMTIHRYFTGTECFSWIVPEKWTCREASLRTVDGRPIFSSKQHPLHVVSYSLSKQGVVSRAELMDHLHTHPLLPDAIPFVFKYYERDWGLCASETLKQSLDQPAYLVDIDTEFTFGSLKVGEWLLPGERQDGYVFCAHLCHPGQANDDLSGLAVGLEVMRQISQRRRKWTYRFLVVPETIGSAAWLAHHQETIPHLRGGLFLEMLGRDRPFTLARSLQGCTDCDSILESAFIRHGHAYVCPFMPMNDERMFNAPGIRIPMLGLYRIEPPESPHWPYLEYHSSEDDAGKITSKSLDESVELVLSFVDALEKASYYKPNYQGEPFLSRFSAYQAWAKDDAMKKCFWDLIYRIDESKSETLLAREIGCDPATLRQVLKDCQGSGLIQHLQ